MGAHAGLTAETTARADAGAPATKKKRKRRSGIYKKVVKQKETQK